MVKLPRQDMQTLARVCSERKGKNKNNYLILTIYIFQLSSLDSNKSVCFKRKLIGLEDLKEPCKKYTDLTDDRLPQVDPIPQFKKTFGFNNKLVIGISN